jgi:hypothetical protein
MENFLEIVSIFAMSTVKFFFSPLMSHELGYSVWETVLITSVGGCTSVLFFYRASGWLMRRARLRRLHREIAAMHGQGRPARKVFTRTNRFIVRVKIGQGLGGLVVMTPVLISLPIGSILAAKYFHNDRRTLPMLLSSVVIWSVVLSSLISVIR